MPKRKYVIRFKTGGYLMDPFTEAPKEFDSNIAAIRYGALSFGHLPSPDGQRTGEWIPHYVVRLGDE